MPGSCYEKRLAPNPYSLRATGYPWFPLKTVSDLFVFVHLTTCILCEKITQIPIYARNAICLKVNVYQQHTGTHQSGGISHEACRQKNVIRGVVRYLGGLRSIQ